MNGMAAFGHGINNRVVQLGHRNGMAAVIGFLVIFTEQTPLFRIWPSKRNRNLQHAVITSCGTHKFLACGTVVGHVLIIIGGGFLLLLLRWLCCLLAVAVIGLQCALLGIG